MMRVAVFLLCFISLGALAQPTIVANQTRAVISSGTGDVGSPIFATGGAVAWSVVSQDNTPHPTIGASEIYFSVDENGQVEVLRSLAAFFPYTAASINITLELRAFDAMGLASADTNVTITIVEDSSSPAPSIATGQSRNIVVTAGVGASVGSALTAGGTPTGWSIDLERNWVDGVLPNVLENERFFDINNAGQITLLVTLERFFQAFMGARGAQIRVELDVTAFNGGGQDSNTITLFVLEGNIPGILGQSRSCVTDYEPNDDLQGPLLAVGNPTYWSIVGGSNFITSTGTFSSAGAFAITAGGQLSTTIFLDNFVYATNPFTVTLQVVCGNQYGESAVTNVPINISVVSTARCGFIPAEQTRYIASTAVGGDPAGFQIDMHGLDSIWIDAAWIGTGPFVDVASYFTIDTNTTTFGQIRVVRDLELIFPTDEISFVRFSVRGHVPAAQCNPYIDQDVFVYVLPDDAGGTGGTGGTGDPGGGTTVDFSSYISDPNLLACIRERVGLTGSLPLTAADVLDLEALDCACRDDSAITDLAGLHLFTSLQNLSLANNMISDIQPIAGLTSLTDLRLAGNLIADITFINPLASLVNLVNLDLSYNQIRETNAFSTLRSLNFISLAHNDICDVTSLVALANFGAIDTNDTLLLDGNHLLTSAGQAQISALQATGAYVSVFDNDGVCPAFRDTLQLPDWPAENVTAFSELIDLNFLLVPCDPP